MREIKFRAWDKVLAANGAKGMLYWPEIRLYKLEVLEPNKPLIFMQFTGLKDKNGKEIYEGDIIGRESGSKYIIEWDETNLRFWMLRIGDGYPFDFFELNAFKAKIEVIGNIYENSELLKGE